MNYLEKPNQSTEDYEILHYNNKSFDLDVNYMDDYYGYSSVSIDALEVYKHLKAYFKGTVYDV